MSRYYIRKGVHYGTADEMIDRIEELEAKGLANRVAIMRLEAKLAKAEVIVRIIASDKWGERLGEAVDLSCEYLAELKGQDDAVLHGD